MSPLDRSALPPDPVQPQPEAELVEVNRPLYQPKPRTDLVSNPEKNAQRQKFLLLTMFALAVAAYAVYRAQPQHPNYTEPVVIGTEIPR